MDQVQSPRQELLGDRDVADIPLAECLEDMVLVDDEDLVSAVMDGAENRHASSPSSTDLTNDHLASAEREQTHCLGFSPLRMMTMHPAEPVPLRV